MHLLTGESATDLVTVPFWHLQAYRAHKVSDLHRHNRVPLSVRVIRSARPLPSVGKNLIRPSPPLIFLAL